MKIIITALTHLVSPTLLIATILKYFFDKTKVIKSLNIFYFLLSIALVVVFYLSKYDRQDIGCILSFAIMLLVYSRSVEIFFAFTNDATDKVCKDPISKSTLNFQERVILAMRSYVELFLGFGVFYWLSPINWWAEKSSGDGFNSPENVIDAVYFSGVTLTTLGYGDITPGHEILKLMTVFEVFCGFSLIVVSFAIYMGHGLNEQKP